MDNSRIEVDKEAKAPWDKLPDELWVHILGYLYPKDDTAGQFTDLYHVAVGTNGRICGFAKLDILSAFKKTWSSCHSPVLAASWSSSYFVNPQGTLIAWGDNRDGQLGVGDRQNRASPTSVPCQSVIQGGIIQVAVGRFHTVVLTEQGEVAVWGVNQYGQLGVGDEEDRTLPTPVPCQSVIQGKIIQVAVGCAHTVVLTEQGEVAAWGVNQYGQLGVGDTKDRTSPTPVPCQSVIQGQIIQVAVGDHHTVVLTDQGEVAAWGYNGYGELGVGDTKSRASPTLVPWDIETQGKIIQVAAGAYHTLVLTERGEVFAWGRNLHGQLGVGDTEERTSPTLVPWNIETQGKIIQIVAGSNHTFVLTDRGEVFAWGDNTYGQLGVGDTKHRTSPTPVPWDIETQGKILQIVAGSGHTLVFTDQGEVWAWGVNGWGQLGLGEEQDKVLLPARIPYDFMKKPSLTKQPTEDTPGSHDAGGNKQLLASGAERSSSTIRNLFQGVFYRPTQSNPAQVDSREEDTDKGCVLQ